MKRWLALILTLALFALPCLPAGAAENKVVDDFEGYQSADEMRRFWGASTDNAAQGGSITLPKIIGMDGVETTVAHLEADNPDTSKKPDVYLQKDGIDYTGEMVTAFRIKMEEPYSSRKVTFREQVGSSGNFLEMISIASQKITCFDVEVKDQDGQAFKLGYNQWYDIVIISTQTPGDANIPYELYINGVKYADATYTKANTGKKFVQSARFMQTLNRTDVRNVKTDFDDIFMGKKSELSFDKMVSEPANGNVAASPEGGVIHVDFGTRMDTTTVQKDRMTLTSYFEGETAEITDYELVPGANGMYLKLPDGKFEKETRYTLTMNDLFDFQGNPIPEDKKVIQFETVGDPYVPEYQTEELVSADFTGFTGTSSGYVTVTANTGTITGETVDDAHGTSAAVRQNGATSSGPWVGVGVPGANVPGSGTVVLQCDVRLTGKDHVLQVFTIKDSANAWNTDLNFRNDGTICRMNGDTVLEKLMDYEANTWYTIREEINLDEKTIDVYINGSLMVKGAGLQNKNLKDVPSARITHLSTKASDVTSYYDNFMVGTKKELPGVMKMKFLDSAGIQRGGQAPMDTQEILLFFSMPMDASTMTAENISLAKTAQHLPVACSVNYDETEKVLSLRPQAALEMNLNYQVNIGAGVKAASQVPVKEAHSLNFESAAGLFGRVHLAVVDDAGGEVLSMAELENGDVVHASAKISNGGDSAKDAVVIFAWYQGDMLKQFVSVPAPLEAYSDDTFVTGDITVDDVSGGSLRVFVWSGESGKQAVCEPLYVD